MYSIFNKQKTWCYILCARYLNISIYIYIFATYYRRFTIYTSHVFLLYFMYFALCAKYVVLYMRNTECSCDATLVGTAGTEARQQQQRLSPRCGWPSTHRKHWPLPHGLLGVEKHTTLSRFRCLNPALLKNATPIAHQRGMWEIKQPYRILEALKTAKTPKVWVLGGRAYIYIYIYIYI